MAKAKLLVLAVPAALTATVVLKYALGLSFFSSFLLILSIPVLPFAIKPLLKCSAGLIKGLGHVLKACSKGIGKALKSLKVVASNPAVLCSLVFTAIGYALGLPLNQIIIAALLPIGIRYAIPAFKGFAKGCQKILIAIKKSMGEGFAHIKKGINWLIHVPGYYRVLGTVAALLARAHPIAALLTGLLTPNPIRIDKLLVIGVAFAFSGYFPPAFGLFTYWGSGVVEPMVVGLIAHKCLEKALIQYLNYERRKPIGPEPTPTSYQTEPLRLAPKPREVNRSTDVPEASLYTPLQAAEELKAEQHQDSGSDNAEELADTLDSDPTRNLSPSTPPSP